MTNASRRAFLTVVGGLSLSVAGCITGDTDSEPTRPTQFEPNELSSIVESPVPQITRPSPIDPTDQSIESRAGAVTSLTEQIPDEITEAEIPNGVIRREISHRKSSAVDAVESALDESSEFRSLRHLSEAQGLANEAKAIYESAIGAVSLTEIEEELATTKRTIMQLLSSLRYVGDSLHQSTLLYYWLESDLLTARNRLHFDFRTRQSNPLRSGEIANNIGYAMGTIEATELLESRQRHQTGGNDSNFPIMYRACSRARESIREFDQLRTDTPEDLVTVDISDTPAERILRSAHGDYRNITQSLTNNLDEGTVANGIHRGIYALTQFEAYTTILDRINNEEYQELSSIDPVIETRETIQEYLENPSISTNTDSVVTDHFAELATWIAAVDDTIQRYANNDNPARIEREYTEYVQLAHRLHALSNAEQTYTSWVSDQ